MWKSNHISVSIYTVQDNLWREGSERSRIIYISINALRSAAHLRCGFRPWIDRDREGGNSRNPACDLLSHPPPEGGISAGDRPRPLPSWPPAPWLRPQLWGAGRGLTPQAQPTWRGVTARKVPCSSGPSGSPPTTAAVRRARKCVQLPRDSYPNQH